MSQQLTLKALRGALTIAIPKINHSDQGVQYAAYDYVDLLKDHEALISMAAVGEAEENGCAERFIAPSKKRR